MVGTGLLMLLVAWAAALQIRRNREPSPRMAKALVAMTFSGWIAVLSGWYTTEIGRQPYLVHGVLRTADALGRVPANRVGLTLVVYLALYLALTIAFVSVLFLLARRAAPAGQSEVSPRTRGRNNKGLLRSGNRKVASHV